jgi:hypothetical protein
MNGQKANKKMFNIIRLHANTNQSNNEKPLHTTKMTSIKERKWLGGGGSHL